MGREILEIMIAVNLGIIIAGTVYLSFAKIGLIQEILIKRSSEMFKLNVNKLDMWTSEDFGREFADICNSEVKEGGIYKIVIGSRNEIEDLEKCEVVDGFVSVYSENCIKTELSEDDFEYVWCGFESGFNIKKNMYMECWDEENSNYYVRVGV